MILERERQTNLYTMNGSGKSYNEAPLGCCFYDTTLCTNALF